MSENIVATGIIEKRRLVDFIGVLYATAPRVDSPLVREARIHFDSDGLHARAVDAGKVAMVNPVEFAPRGFESYDAPGKVTIAADLESVLDKIGPAAAGDLVEFDVDMETRHLRLHYGSADVTVAMFDPETVREEPDDLDLDLPNTVTLAGEQLAHAVEVPNMVSDHITVECDPDDREVRFVGQGDTDDATVAYGDGELEDPTTVGAATESVFSTDYFRLLTNPIPDDSSVTIRLGDEFPMTLDWGAYDGVMSAYQMCAPRVQSR